MHFRRRFLLLLLLPLLSFLLLLPPLLLLLFVLFLLSLFVRLELLVVVHAALGTFQRLERFRRVLLLVAGGVGGPSRPILGSFRRLPRLEMSKTLTGIEVNPHNGPPPTNASLKMVLVNNKGNGKSWPLQTFTNNIYDIQDTLP